jgi:nucleoside phosphorylase
MSHTILFLAANPVGTAPRELDREVRAIQSELERSGFRDQFSFETRWAVEPLDLLRELRKHKPVVVHYSGHGGQDGLFLQDEGGGSRLVSTEALAQTFGAAGASVKVVILSACYSDAQANALLEHVDCVVGMGTSIDADAARSFAIGFYGGLGERESIAAAFQQGMAAISLMGVRDSGRPQLKVRRGVDADRIVLAGSSGGRDSPAHMLNTSRVDVPALHKKIMAQFLRHDIGQLCIELEERLRADGIDESISIDIVGGQSTSEIARNLISHLQRRGLLPYLVEIMNAGRFILAADRAKTEANEASTGAAAVSRPSQLGAGKRLPRMVDIGILTIRDDEFRAVLGAFPNRAGTYKGVSREYSLRHADAGNGARYTVAALRLVEQGHGEAQDAARDLIDDLAPRLILVVGIAGGLPSDDVTLGDVVVSTRIHDFTIEARQAGQDPAYAVTGGPVDKALAAAVANLPAREDELGSWTADLPVRPQLSWTRRGDLYGPTQWQSELRVKLEQHHGKRSTSRAPRYIAGPIASSDRLVKDPDLLIPWLQVARNLLAIEMESGGVFRAVRERCPMLAIRGISDIVGLRRADNWTKYACASAAAFTRAFLRTRPIEVSSSEDVDTISAATSFERLWHRLRTATPPNPVTAIAPQRWREIQPNVEEVVRDRTVERRVVFTSEGGVGKSRLLATLYDEQTGTRVWVDTVAPLEDLEEALAFGARAGHPTGEALTIFVDAIEQADDPAALLGAIERALVACDRAVVYAATRLATWTDIRDRLSGWRGVRLERWSAERVHILAQAGRAEPLSADLIDLLRTPLLLDLFLRTFASGNAVPAGLATRHSVLGAYFERRVYAGASAAARRVVLDAGVATVLANGATWRDVTPAADQLTSEGVVMALFGELRFRHALLRDFSAALQLVPRTAQEIAAALRDVINPVVRSSIRSQCLAAHPSRSWCASARAKGSPRASRWALPTRQPRHC